ncbi:MULTISPECIES: response regulator transcription factor [Cupriavidus]|jgi:FixJ family two-component response regulator|uniref:Response regulator n=1 Tax=Cupriavidus metallidurans TaxID=119219 RepID=A0A482IRC3_9BURK|nr:MULTISPECIES: response regulator [Cupriavidus]KWR72309.1 histidine kinase [Cupriavidus sp. SHE]QBP09669.1 response regulator [Cupriavidus metallidurans]QWC90020.1 response regulator [Cupriavidus metallidurans]
MGSSGQFAVVIDDDESVARAISRLLRAAGIAVDTFTSGTVFLDQILSQPAYRPACVILDVSMPHLDGLEVQRRLGGLSLPIIFITAHDVPEARNKALSAGAIGYLRKPFNTQQLIELVRGVMTS